MRYHPASLLHEWNSGNDDLNCIIIFKGKTTASYVEKLLRACGDNRVRYQEPRPTISKSCKVGNHRNREKELVGCSPEIRTKRRQAIHASVQCELV